jgi:hypothetical protein
MRLKLLFFLWLVISLPLLAQDVPTPITQLEVGDIEQFPAAMVNLNVVDGDTTVKINYYTVHIFTNMRFPTAQQYAQWDRLKGRVKKEYPYAILIGAKVKECDKQIAGMNEREKKAYMEKMENELKDEFEAAFRGNSVEEAKILIKLVDRETGHTSHELIKRFKGGFSAFMWQSVAVVCGTNLKSKYDTDGEDKLIEQAIYLVESGQI